MKLPSKPNRIGIFAFYDADGIVDDYIPMLVGAVREHCTLLLCVVNGELSAEGRQKLAAVSDEILCRPNEGLDVTGYQQGLFHLEEKARRADEVLFFNQTVFGPVYPLSEMFDAMGERDLDFWGMTRHKGLKADLTGTVWEKVEYGYIPPHIQSYFFAVRASLLHSAAFWNYWREMPVIHDYVEAVSFHEMRFTKYFKDLGFCGAPYLDCSEWEPYMDYPLMGMAAEMVRKKRAPLVKRKSFVSARTSYLSVPQGGAGWELLQYLDKNTEYPIDLILRNLTRTVPMAELMWVMSPSVSPEAVTPQKGRVALVFWLQDPMFLPDAQRVAATLPKGGAIFALCADKRIEEEVKVFLPQAICSFVEENGFVALFKALWKEISSFDAVLYLPLVPPQGRDSLQNLTLMYTALNALGDAGRDLAMLRQLSGAGMLAPVPDRSDEFFCGAIPTEELTALPQAVRGTPLDALLLGERLERFPGNAFFSSTELLAPLAELPWKDEAFCGGCGGAAEFLLPLAAQLAGRLCGFVLPWEDAVRELWNAREYAGRFARIFRTPNKQKPDLIEYRMQWIKDFYDERRYQMTLEQAFKAKLSFKQKLWIISQLLLSPQAFERLQRLLHRGKLPPAHPQPKDPLD